jgi:hypothetical protein
MRHLLAGGATLAALLVCAVPAFGATHVTIRYGDHVTLNGTAAAGAPVTLSAQSSGKTVQAIRTAQANGGSFRFEVAPTAKTVYTAQAGAKTLTYVVDVAPRVGLTQAGTVRVESTQSLTGRPVFLQLWNGAAWRSFARTTIGAGGVATFGRWSPLLTVRAFVPGVVAGTSRVYTAACGCTIRLP